MKKHLILFGSVTIAAASLGTFLLAYYWPHLVNGEFKSAILKQGFGDGPIPVNTLYTEPQKLFEDPIHTSLPSGNSDLMTRGVNHDTLLTVGCLDLKKGPLVLIVPDFSGRYYSIQFTDPFNTNFAYIGTRTTGTKASAYLIAGPGWHGTIPSGTTEISSPNNSVLVLGRVLVYSEDDVSTAFGLAKQIRVTPLSQ
jgi:hypothetical protein